MGEEKPSSMHFLTSALEEAVVRFTPRPFYTLVMSCWYSSDRDWMVARARLGALEEDVLMMDADDSSETSVLYQQITLRNIQEDTYFQASFRMVTV
jgi:hypothetical protein